MTHGHSLRSNAKGRKQKSTDETDDQVEGTSTSSSSTSERISKTLTDELDDESGIVDPRPTSPDTPRAAHNSRAPTQDSKPQTMKEDEDQQRHSRSIVICTSSSVIRRRVEGCRRPEETREEIQAARKREEARRLAEAVLIRRKQVVRGYEEELCALRARIVALRSECEVRVKKARRKWELDWEIERGEVAVVVDEGVSSSSFVVSSDSNWNWEDADGEMQMAVDNLNAPTEMPSSCWSRSKSNFLLPAPASAPVRKTQHQQQQPHMGLQGTFPLSGMGMGMPQVMSYSQLQAGMMATDKKHDDDNDDESGPCQWPGEAHTGTSTSRRRIFPSQGRSSQPPHPHPQPQPLRRQPAQLLMGIPTGTFASHGLDT
jgi:hypothetical protein